MKSSKKPLTDEQKAQRAEARLTAKFEKAALGVSKMCAVSLHDIRGAYADKKDSLSALFDAAKEARNHKYEWLIAPLFTLLAPPLMLTLPVLLPVCVYKAVSHHRHQKALQGEVVREVELFRAREVDAAAPVADTALKSPFATRIVR